jgi:hypothetical protein
MGTKSRIEGAGMTVLRNSDRQLLKATHTALPVEPSDTPPGRALEKHSYINGLQLRSGELATIRRDNAASDAPIAPETWDLLEQYEPALVPALRPSPSFLVDISLEDLQTVGKLLVASRTTELTTVLEQKARLTEPVEVDAVSEAVPMSSVSDIATQIALAQSLVTTAKGALDTFTNGLKISPIGMLHLERIEMAPAGIERGELVATIPLAPHETTSVTQKEWTVTSEELSSIVTDFLEDHSERGVTEKSELAQATESQTKRNQQLGLDASVSGSYGFVTFSTSAKFSLTTDITESTKASRKHASEVTGKASSRVRKERKVTIQSTSTTGKEQTNVRTLTNPSDTDAMRIDYYSMMRKWRVRLFQYGLRLTYDIAIPEPGGTLRKVHAEIAQIDTLSSRPFTYGLTTNDITRASYKIHAAAVGAVVPEPPRALIEERVGGQVPGLDDGEGWHFHELVINVPDGYMITNVFLDALLGNVNNDDPAGRSFIIFGFGSPAGLDTHGKASFIEDLTAKAGFLKNRSGAQKIVYFTQCMDAAAVTFAVRYEPLPETFERWQSAVLQTIISTARDTYYTNLRALADRRAALVAKILNADTLTLRREERDEIMKGVLRWLLGPTFDFMPPEVVKLFSTNPQDQQLGTSFTSNDLGLTDSGWATMFVYQEMVKFIHQAIEWENMLYFPYPYFWDVPSSWDFVRSIEHPDSTRQQFLRSGSARVVLTIRPGFEEAFAGFVDQGSLGALLPPNHPYLSIGQEIRAFDQTNYPGIPPANPAVGYRSLITPLQRKAWTEMQAIMALLDTYHTTNQRYPTTAEGLAVLGPVPAADPWGRPYRYQSPGTVDEYELTTYGDDDKPGGEDSATDISSLASASLIAEWYEYTPSHGIDIEVNTAPASMA